MENVRPNETAVCELLRKQLRRYEQAKERLDAISSRLQSVGWSEPLQQHLQSVITDIVNEDERETIRAWNKTGMKASLVLKRVTEDAKVAIVDLLDRVNAVEKIARNLRDQLVPQIDMAARGRQAVNAYRQSAVSRHTRPKPRNNE